MSALTPIQCNSEKEARNLEYQFKKYSEDKIRDTRIAIALFIACVIFSAIALALFFISLHNPINTTLTHAFYASFAMSCVLLILSYNKIKKV